MEGGPCSVKRRRFVFVCCMLYVVCCMLYAVCCMLYAVCMLYVDREVLTDGCIDAKGWLTKCKSNTKYSWKERYFYLKVRGDVFYWLSLTYPREERERERERDVFHVFGVVPLIFHASSIRKMASFTRDTVKDVQRQETVDDGGGMLPSCLFVLF
jgi:hypothetical protein